jgi:hypothetical protein
MKANLQQLSWVGRGLRTAPLTGRARSPHRAGGKNTFARLVGTASPTADLGAFSLIEVMASVAILTVIILGLVAMFGQTRRAFTSSLTQVDVLEAGRAAADIVGRDVEQAVPGYYTNGPNFFVDTPVNYVPLVQTLPNGVDTITNKINEVYFLTRYNQTWNGVGYQVVFNDASRMVGTLYRYYAPNIYVPITNQAVAVPSLDLRNQAAVFTNHAVFPMDPSISTNRIIDGVVDFRVRVFDPKGLTLSTNNIPRNCLLQTNIPSGDISYCRFTSNALPAFVELELGVLESRTYENYRALTNNAAAAQTFLQNHAAQVHVFRQRIPLRGVDPSAYP